MATVARTKHGRPEPSVEELLGKVEEDRVDFVNMQFTDVMGIVKSVMMPITQLEEALTNGVWFDGSSIDGFTRIAESDMFLMPDRATVLGHSLGEERAHDRAADLRRLQAERRALSGRPARRAEAATGAAGRIGFGFNTGPELEFFLFRKDGDDISPLPHDRASYFDVSTDLASDVRKDMVQALAEMGITVEQAHHEVAIGQHEIDFRYADALQTADNAITFKFTLKAIAQRHGLHATFMPKPLEGINGSGMHTHQSFYRARRQRQRLRGRGRPVRAVATRAAVHRRAARTTRAAWPRSSRRWSTPTAGWCQASRRPSTSAGRTPTARR